MSTKARKQKAAATRPGTQGAGLRRDVQEAIDRVWPDGIVELSFDSAESYVCGVHARLSRAFHRLRNARLVHEREADGGPIWWDQSDPEEDPPDEIERSRSYHLFFVSPEGEAFTFETEAEGIAEPEFISEEFEEAGWGEGPSTSKMPGTGRTGWVVAVSLLAPFAVIELREFLAARSGVASPDTVARLLDDVAERCTEVQDRELARVIECADAALAALIANDTRTRKHCLRAGERHLVVPASPEAAFRRALRDAGYLLSAGVTRPRAAGV